MNIYQKIVEVRKSIEGFSKDTKGFNFSYVSGNQILRAIKTKIDELGLLLIPSIDQETLKWEKHEYITSKGKSALDFIVEAKMTYTWINADEPSEQIVVPWVCIGQQADDIAKAMGTAMTYNERYFLLKFFGLPTDEDDADNRQLNDDDKPAYSNSKKGSLSESQIKRLYAIANSKGISREKVQEAILKQKGKSVEQLSREEYNIVCEYYEGK